jgi:hypothetical protein
MKMHRNRGSALPVGAEEAIGYARQAAVWKRSSYFENIERLERVFSSNRIFYGFFEELTEEPASFIKKLLAFLGVPAADVARLLPRGPVNVAAAGRRPPPEFSRALAHDFKDEVEKLCARFDGPPQEWRTRYQALLNGKEPGRREGL